MGQRNERSDPPPHRVRRVRSPRTVCTALSLQSPHPCTPSPNHPFLRALATPPGVLPTACAFRWSEAFGCSRAALWEPFSSQDGPSLTHELSQRRQGLSKTSPGAHWASFEGPSGPSRAHLERHKGHFGPFGRPLHLSSSHIHHKSRTSKKHRKIHKILTILAFSGFSFRLSGSSRASLRALAAILDPADALCDRPRSLSGPSSAVWALSWRHLEPSWARPGGPWRPF